MKKHLLLTVALLLLASPLCAQVTTISGSKGSNVSAPSTTKNVPVLPAIACGATGNAVTSGRVVFPCTDLFSSANVIIRNSDGTVATIGTDVTEDVASTDAVTGPTPLTVRRDTAVSSASTSGDYATVNQDANGLAWVRTLDPCSATTPTTDPFSITTDTVIISALSAKKNYICAIIIVASAAEIVSITEGTGAVCGTSEAALMGSTTDANGLSFAANGGAAWGSGGFAVIKGKTTNVDTCLNVSGANRISGSVTYVQAP